MIKADHLSKQFGETVAVDDLSFEVAPGILVAVLRDVVERDPSAARAAHRVRLEDDRFSVR